MGGSAGGLLMGAVVNQAPELFLGIIMAVPFVDSLTTNLDHSLPLTVGEFNEFGNAKENKKHFDYIRSYSPYENIKKTLAACDLSSLYCLGLKLLAMPKESSIKKRVAINRDTMYLLDQAMAELYKA